MTITISDVPVRKSILVRTPVEDAFEVFTEEIDSWWPRSHHIGKSPLRRVVMEGRAGGRCYTEHADGSESDWGRVLEWEPPHRLVLAWRITHEWTHEPDLARASEVEVRFVPQPGAVTRVHVEHRFFDRHGAGGDTMRGAVDAPNGWTKVLALFADQVSARGTRETVQRYFDHLAAHEGWEGLLAPDLVFTSYTSPIKQVNGRDAFLTSTSRFYSTIASVQVRDLLVDGERACALTRYELQPPNGGPRFASDVAEVFSVRNGKIDSFSIYFDTAPYPK